MSIFSDHMRDYINEMTDAELTEHYNEAFLDGVSKTLRLIRQTAVLSIRDGEFSHPLERHAIEDFVNGAELGIRSVYPNIEFGYPDFD